MSRKSQELQVSGAIVFALGWIFLLAENGLNTISMVTRIEIESLQIICIIGILGGTALFVMGLRSRKEAS